MAITIPAGTGTSACSSTTTTYASTCAVTCANGYSGTETVTCQGDGSSTTGTWSATPVCEAITCAAYAGPDNGQSNCNSGTSVFGNQCTISCSDGYSLTVGESTITCGEGTGVNGEWSDASHKCEAGKCAEIPQPSHGSSSCDGSSRNLNASCVVGCSLGYYLNGTSIVKCNAVEGSDVPKWTDDDQTCELITCGSISSPNNGNSDCSAAETITVGEKCSIICDEGYALSGETMPTCNSGIGTNGQWSDDSQSCTRITCGPITSPTNGISTCATNTSDFGANCTMSCNSDDYYLDGLSSVKCGYGEGSSGQWDDSSQQCQKIQCPQISNPSNGQSSCTDSNTDVNGNCTFTCVTNYILSDSQMLDCSKPSTPGSVGSWSNDPPQCNECTSTTVAQLQSISTSYNATSNSFTFVLRIPSKQSHSYPIIVKMEDGSGNNLLEVKVPTTAGNILEINAADISANTNYLFSAKEKIFCSSFNTAREITSAKLRIAAQITLDQEFTPDFNNPTSNAFIQLAAQVCDSINNVASCQVLSMSSGSVIALVNVQSTETDTTNPPTAEGSINDTTSLNIIGVSEVTLEPAPQNFNVLSVSETTIVVQWDTYSGQQSCVVYSDSDKFNDEHVTTETTATIENLSAATTYGLSVTCTVLVGSVPTLTEEAKTTGTTAPSAPTNLGLKQINHNSIQVEFNSIIDVTYSIDVTNVGDETDTINFKFYDDMINNGLVTVTVTVATPSTQYRVSVRNEISADVFSSQITDTTTTGPSTVSNVRVYSVIQNEFRVAFDAVTLTSPVADIVYVVSYANVDGLMTTTEGNTIPVVITADTSSLTTVQVAYKTSLSSELSSSTNIKIWSIDEITSDEATISWDNCKLPGTKQYQPIMDGVNIGSPISTTEATYSVSANTVYSLSVNCIAEDGGTTSTEKLFTISILTAPAQPIITATTTENALKFSWAAIPGAVIYNYDIQHPTQDTISGQTTDTSIEVSGNNVILGSQYTVQVTAVNVNDLKSKTTFVHTPSKLQFEYEVTLSSSYVFVEALNDQSSADYLNTASTVLALIDNEIANKYKATTIVVKLYESSELGVIARLLTESALLGTQLATIITDLQTISDFTAVTEGYNKCLDKPCGENASCERNGVDDYTCTCLNGYSGNGNVCSDVNECDGVNKCDDNGVCNNTIGSYVCDCNNGYTSSGFSCIDVNECTTGKDDCPENIQTACINEDGSFRCACVSGYEDTSNKGYNCTDKNECDSNPCDNNASCDNYDGGYSCQCNNGYVGDASKCTDINECEVNSTICSGTDNSYCSNTGGSYKCLCNSGFNKNGDDCVDDNECERQNDCSENANCTNTAGSYTCQCKDGFFGNGILCIDNGDCEPTTSGCDANAICRVVDGNVQCTCKTGYEGNGADCNNINECEKSELNNCNGFKKCVDNDGSYTCICKDGYLLNEFTGDCVEINECDTNPCPQNSKCTDEINGFTCQCDPGFTGSPPGTDCDDVVECDTDNICQINSNCFNTFGSYICKCIDGYEDINGVCEEVDNCSPNQCTNNTNCVNLINGYNCTCKDGFEGDSCTDVNECENKPCKENEMCANYDGGYQCICSSGYEIKSNECVDVDECQLNSCKENEECKNVAGSFFCECATGYSGNPCANINECELPTTICGNNEVCVDTNGGYTCNCKDGYQEIDGQCVDINECATTCANNSCCTDISTCVNLQGSFECACITDYTFRVGKCRRDKVVQLTLNDEYQYIEAYKNKSSAEYKALATEIKNDALLTFAVDDADVVSIDQGSVIAIVKLWPENDDTTVQQLIDTRNTTGIVDIYKNIVPADISACYYPTQCDDNASCVQDACVCDDGYEGDGYICTEADACASDPCTGNKNCTLVENNVGYECFCSPGTTNVNEVCYGQCNITLAYCKNGGTCVPTNTVGNPVCKCTSGYSGERCDSSASYRTVAIVLGVLFGVLFIILIIGIVKYLRDRKRGAMYNA